MIEKYDYACEELLGQWVAARLKKRYDLGHGAPPDAVCTWVRTAGNSAADQNCEAPALVLGWLIKSIEDPDWAE